MRYRPSCPQLLVGWHHLAREREKEAYALTGICLDGHAGEVNSVFAVLAEPRRRQILDLVRAGECSVNELVAILEMNQPAVSKHLRVLREAGLVRVRVDEQRRLYRLSPAPLLELDRWLAPYRAAWGASLDKLERHLDQMTDEETGEVR
jgi:DNA-binding transcriptional ArsR family regulator